MPYPPPRTGWSTALVLLGSVVVGCGLLMMLILVAGVL